MSPYVAEVRDDDFAARDTRQDLATRSGPPCRISSIETEPTTPAATRPRLFSWTQAGRNELR